jgi:hypothetical protein
MRKWPYLVVAGAALVTIATSSYALADDATKINAQLSGFQEVPTRSTSGFGRFEAKLDRGEIQYKLKYEDLEGTTTGTAGAHLHLGARATNGGVIAFLCGGGSKPACPASRGTITGVITPDDVLRVAGQGIAAGEFDEVVAAMRAGVTYVNVHTSVAPDGEIRGQVKKAD